MISNSRPLPSAAPVGPPSNVPASPSSPFLINSSTSQPHRFRTPNAPNHRHTRPTLPPFLRRADDGLARLILKASKVAASSIIKKRTYHFRTTPFLFLPLAGQATFLSHRRHTRQSLQSQALPTSVSERANGPARECPIIICVSESSGHQLRRLIGDAVFRERHRKKVIFVSRTVNLAESLDFTGLQRIGMK